MHEPRATAQRSTSESLIAYASSC